MDIVIVTHSKDKDILQLLLISIEHYINNYRNIYIISKDNYVNENKDDTLKKNKYISEDNFPFTKEMIIKELESKKCPEYRFGWYYQQLLKLYSFKVIKELSDYILILDSDVVFLQQFELFDKNNKPYFTISDEKLFHMNLIMFI
jgi:hypothetical protein